MKREIVCPSCAERIKKVVLPSDPGEGVKWQHGTLKGSCRCDNCNRAMSPGDDAVAFSLYVEGRYFEWESGFLEFDRPARLDSEGRDVTDLPGLWSEEDCLVAPAPEARHD